MVHPILDKAIDMCCSGDAKQQVAPVTTSSQPEKKAVNTKKPEKAPVVDEAESAPAKTETGLFSGKDVMYEDAKWADLPKEAREAAAVLGYDEAAWDDGWAHASDKHWRDLSEAEKQAAATLGWNEAAWEHKYEETDWADVPQVVRDAATKAGFTQEMWDADEFPAQLDVEWSELSDADRNAMLVLGYGKYGCKWE